jgi:hypothetical protein
MTLLFAASGNPVGVQGYHPHRLAHARDVRLRIAFDCSAQIPRLPTIAISGEYRLANMPLGLLVDYFFRKGDYRPQQLLAKIEEVIAASPIRPHTLEI